MLYICPTEFHEQLENVSDLGQNKHGCEDEYNNPHHLESLSSSSPTFPSYPPSKHTTKKKKKKEEEEEEEEKIVNFKTQIHANIPLNYTLQQNKRIWKKKMCGTQR